MNQPAEIAITGKEHWTRKGDVKLFIWEKPAVTQQKKGAILFVHGSSMGSQATFDLQVPGRPDSSAMDYFAKQGFDTWCVDLEGYGRSGTRDINCDIANGVDDLKVATDYIMKARGVKQFMAYGICASRETRWTPSCGPGRAARRSTSGARGLPSSPP